MERHSRLLILWTLIVSYPDAVFEILGNGVEFNVFVYREHFPSQVGLKLGDTS